MLWLLSILPVNVLAAATEAAHVATTAAAKNANWFMALFSETESVAHAVLILGLVGALGLALGSIKAWGISLGIGGVLFSGILFGHLGYTLNHQVMEFVRDFGLILFVYTIGMQVGPGFLASLRKQGLPLNIMAAGIIVLGVAITLGVHFIGHVPMPSAVGLLSGAVTNTPSMAAAQQALKDVAPATVNDPPVGYAMAYPFGIMGIIISMLLIRFVMRINLNDEQQAILKMNAQNRQPLLNMNLEVKNPNLDGLPLRKIPAIRQCGAVVSRIFYGDKMQVAKPSTIVKVGAVLHAVGQKEGLEELRTVVGGVSRMDLKALPSHIIYRRVMVTKSHPLGKTIEELNLPERFNVTVTRVGRGDVEMTPDSTLKLQFGDTLRVVGEEEAIKEVAGELGDSAKQLNHPHVIPIFLGIALGVILGSWAINIPGFPAPVKLGLAGGPLVVAIILSRVGNIGPLVWYMPVSANFMVRELGIVLFLACVGLSAGTKFFHTLTDGPGVYWMMLASIITLVPLLTVGFIARIIFKINYMTVCGLLAGSMTDPPALAFAGQVTGSDAPSVAYATVYPLTMLLRVLFGQALVLLFMH